MLKYSRLFVPVEVTLFDNIDVLVTVTVIAVLVVVLPSDRELYIFMFVFVLLLDVILCMFHIYLQ